VALMVQLAQLLCLGCSLIEPLPAGSPATPAIPIVVRIYTDTAADRLTLGRMRKIAEEVFLASSLSARWLDCRYGAADAQCGTPVGPTTFIVRILEARPDRHSHGCGVSIRPRKGAAGHLVTLYTDCVREASDGLRIDSAVILAYALAHEVGHLLLPDDRHGFSGIMRKQPDALDWERAARGRLRFTPGEIALMREGLLARARRTVSARP
jgi:hypothetical protein